MQDAFKSHQWAAERDFREYAGKWIAVFNQEVIGVGNTAAEALTIAKQNNKTAKPLLKKISS